MNSDNPWTEADIARLRELWAEGLSGAQIGQLMGRSGYSVLGARKRYHLPMRASPLRPRDPGLSMSAIYRRAAKTRKATEAARKAKQAALKQSAPTLAPPPEAPPTGSTAPAMTPLRPPAACCWPIGEPRARDFRFCEAVPVDGRPYCPAHCKAAFVKIRDRPEDIA